MARVITIAREYGSGANSIAPQLADRLGWRILDHETIASVIRAARTISGGAPQWQGDLWFRRLVQEVAWNGGVERLAAGDEFSVRHLVIEEAARMRDCVIVGRGAQCILRGFPDVFHVFLYAPIEVRVERVTPMDGDPVQVESTINRRDAEQAELVRERFGYDWRDPQLYDLMIDTRRGYRPAVEAIFAAAEFRMAAAAR